MVKFFIPIESNPEVFDLYSTRIGASNVPTQYSWQDVFGLDPELLAMVPGADTTLAVLLLFPITADTENLRKEEQLKLANTAPPTDVYFMKQTIGNACGTIGLLHCVANLTDQLNIDPNSFISQFLEATKDLDSDKRGKFLESPPEGAPTIDAIHEAAATAEASATAAPDADANIDLHFATFVVKNGHLWELDGRKAQAIDHGPSERGMQLLTDVSRVIKENFVEKANSLNFSLLALTAAK